ncbi:MAG: DedA family protein [Bdellovibrionales bacterium]|nr:DedA family protein [Bdellovibrionales bacterium]
MEATGFSAKLLAFLSGFSGVTAYAIILGVLLACGLGVPIPEDITLIAAGLLAGLGKISLTGALIAGMVGVLAGDSFLFFLGRKFGRRAYQLPIIRKILTPERALMAETKIQNNSQFICFTARFLPGLRAPIFLTAGIMGVRPLTFFILDGVAALISVPVWVVGAWYFSKNIDEAIEFAKQMHIYLLIGLVVIIPGYILFKVIKKKKSKKSKS